MNAKFNSPARALADLADGSILAVIEISAPPERVFRALASEEISSWWGSKETYHVTRWSGDVRPGGKWCSDGLGVDGQAFSVGGEFLEVDPPRRLSYTWIAPWDENHSTTVTFVLEPVAGGTRLTLRHTGFAGRSASCGAHTEGWSRVLDWLAAYAAPNPQLRYFLCRLIPPRPDFARSLDVKESAVMKEHGLYWRTKLAEGLVLAFGPVADPAGDWGVGMVRAASIAQVEAFRDSDPAMKSGLGFRFEILPMLSAVTA
jgi:uncharacterized protein YndB with AHSA1/START domain